MTRLVLALAFAAALAPFSWAQALERTAFETRRRELSGRFAAARTVEEKEAILEEFRRLELALAPAEDRSTAGTSGATGATGATVQGSNPAGSPDSRLASLERLIELTELELSPSWLPEWPQLRRSAPPAGAATVANESAGDIADLRSGRDELHAWLEAGRDEAATRRAGGTPEAPIDLEQWAAALAETGTARHVVADWLIEHHLPWRIRTERAELTRLRTRLAGQRISRAWALHVR